MTAPRGTTAWTYLTPQQQSRYSQFVKDGQRKGQAWFNVLDPWDQQVLRATPFDPFHSDSAEVILAALAHLIETQFGMSLPPEQGVTQ